MAMDELMKLRGKMAQQFWCRSLPLATCIALLIGVLMIGCSGSGSKSEGTYKPFSEPIPTVKKIAPKEYASAPPMMIDKSKRYTAVIHTNKGDITADLFAQDAPITVNNFVFLSRDGFYNSVTFHRIIEGFMIQTGDPTGTGSGGPGYTFKDEPILRDYTVGTLAMANRGADTNGSQFFICDADLIGESALPKNYTIFGRVSLGIEVVHEIASAPVEIQNRELSKPTVDLHIDSIEILEKS